MTAVVHSTAAEVAQCGDNTTGKVAGRERVGSGKAVPGNTGSQKHSNTER